MAGKRKLLKIKVKKTKGMTIGNNTIPYEVEGRAIEKVDQFKYLGSIKTRHKLHKGYESLCHNGQS